MTWVTPSHLLDIPKHEFLGEMNIRPGTLAREIGVDRGRIADTALRLVKFLGEPRRSSG
jgi:plasmid maintenance system antidote protein VapI